MAPLCSASALPSVVANWQTSLFPLETGAGDNATRVVHATTSVSTDHLPAAEARLYRPSHARNGPAGLQNLAPVFRARDWLVTLFRRRESAKWAQMVCLSNQFFRQNSFSANLSHAEQIAIITPKHVKKKKKCAVGPQEISEFFHG